MLLSCSKGPGISHSILIPFHQTSRCEMSILVRRLHVPTLKKGEHSPPQYSIYCESVGQYHCIKALWAASFCKQLFSFVASVTQCVRTAGCGVTVNDMFSVATQRDTHTLTLSRHLPYILLLAVLFVCRVMWFHFVVCVCVWSRWCVDLTFLTIEKHTLQSIANTQCKQPAIFLFFICLFRVPSSVAKSLVEIVLENNISNYTTENK